MKSTEEIKAPFNDRSSPYEDRLVIFIDVLGFSAAVKESISNNQDSWRLAGLLGELVERNTEREESDTSGWRQHIGYRGRRYLSASDSLFISSKERFLGSDLADQAVFPSGFKFDPIGDSRFYRHYLSFLPLASAFRECAKIQANLLSQGFLTRGGIQIGQLRHHKGVIVGPAVVDAVCIEGNVGKNIPAAKIPASTFTPILDKFKALKQYRQDLIDNPAIDIESKWARSGDDNFLESTQSQKWLDIVENPFSCIERLEQRYYVLDFIKLADREYLWSQNERNRGRDLAMKNLENLMIARWHLSKSKRGRFHKWRWINQRLRKLDDIDKF